MPFLGLGPDRPLGSLPEWRVEVAGVVDITAEDTLYNTLRVATEPFITRGSDDPSFAQFEPGLVGDIRIDTACESGGFTGFVLNVSEFHLINSDGAFDDSVDQNSINGQSIAVRIGAVELGEVSAFNSHELLASLQGERWWMNRSQVTVETRDPAASLDVLAQFETYSGVGGLEGGAELTGKPRPFGDGVVFNATPALVIASEGLFQYSTGASDSLDAVKDGGIELDFVADYATVDLLRTAARQVADGGLGLIPPGSYGSCEAESYFSIGGAAFKEVTCDFTGPNSTTADIIEAKATETGIEIETWSFEQLNDVQPATVGYFLGTTSTETCREMFGKLMAGIGGFAGMTPHGTLMVQRFEAPDEVAAETYDLNGGNLVEVDRVKMPTGYDPPPRRRRVAYERNWTQQTDLYGQVTEGDPDLAAYLGQTSKFASTGQTETDAVLADYPHAPDDVAVEAYFAERDDALDEAFRLHEFDIAGYKAFRAVLKNAVCLHQVGQVIRLKDTSIAPRLGLGSGRTVRLYSVVNDLGQMQTEAIGVG